MGNWAHLLILFLLRNLICLMIFSLFSSMSSNIFQPMASCEVANKDFPCKSLSKTIFINSPYVSISNPSSPVLHQLNHIHTTQPNFNSTTSNSYISISATLHPSSFILNTFFSSLSCSLADVHHGAVSSLPTCIPCCPLPENSYSSSPFCLLVTADCHVILWTTPHFLHV